MSRDSLPTHRQTAPYWEEYRAELVEDTAGRSRGRSGAPSRPPLRKEVESLVGREWQRPERGLQL